LSGSGDTPAGGLVRLLDKAQHRHGDDAIERCVRKGQRFSLPMNQLKLDSLGLGATMCGREHLWVCIESRDPSTAACKHGCERAVAAADVQHA
jgi:hypothetical protein